MEKSLKIWFGLQFLVHLLEIRVPLTTECIHALGRVFVLKKGRQAPGESHVRFLLPPVVEAA